MAFYVPETSNYVTRIDLTTSAKSDAAYVANDAEKCNKEATNVEWRCPQHKADKINCVAQRYYIKCAICRASNYDWVNHKFLDNKKIELPESKITTTEMAIPNDHINPANSINCGLPLSQSAIILNEAFVLKNQLAVLQAQIDQKEKDARDSLEKEIDNSHYQQIIQHVNLMKHRDLLQDVIGICLNQLRTLPK